jgi:hypothetical protein
VDVLKEALTAVAIGLVCSTATAVPVTFESPSMSRTSRDDTVFDPRTVGGGRTTYGAITAGLTIKPMVPAPLTGLMIRPELRYDWSLNGTHPFNDSPDQDMFTAAVDFVVMF